MKSYVIDIVPESKSTLEHNFKYYINLERVAHWSTPHILDLNQIYIHINMFFILIKIPIPISIHFFIPIPIVEALNHGKPVNEEVKLFIFAHHANPNKRWIRSKSPSTPC